eukprot:750223-Hanusia_phi.AAC.2
MLLFKGPGQGYSDLPGLKDAWGFRGSVVAQNCHTLRIKGHACPVLLPMSRRPRLCDDRLMID